MKRIWLASGAALLLAGCQPTLDTGSAEAYAKSVNAITKDMNADQKSEFQSALVAIAFQTADPSHGMWSNADPAAPIFLAAGDKIKGKNAAEIIKLGYQTRLGIVDQTIASDAAAIQQAQAERAKNSAIFDNIKIDGAKYHISKSMFLEQPEISFKIINATRIPIKRIYLHGLLSSPGRSLPWVSDDINYEFSGGLEPGESKSLDLEPNMFGDWKINDDYSRRSDLSLALTVSNVEGANGEKVLHIDGDDVEAKKADAAKSSELHSQLKAKLDKL